MDVHWIFFLKNMIPATTHVVYQIERFYKHEVILYRMDKRKFDFAAGIVLIIASILFFAMPAFLNMDAFIPFLFALVSFVLGIGFFFMGHGEK
jgi:ABC-type polysaccharide/polyol phosphate export permease